MSRKIVFEVNGKKLSGYAQIIQGKLWTHFDGLILTEDHGKGSRKRRSAEGKSSTNLLHAPMPGKITKICVVPGSAIELGQAVIVMEAMKMEYTLKSELTTTVEKIHVSVGEQVQLGQILVKLTEVADTGNELKT
jgi:acetyl/propionyl-CoA carboxylase alpha subunit